MQAAIAMLPARACSLVPHSTRPVWHDWPSAQQQQENQQQAGKSSARRRLFPEDKPEQERNEQFVQRLLAELAEHYKQKWNFDFEKGRPLTEQEALDCGQLPRQYHYQAIPADQVPGFYRMCHPPEFGIPCRQMPTFGGQKEFAWNDENQFGPEVNGNGIGMVGKKAGENCGAEDGQPAEQSTADTIDMELEGTATATAATSAWKSPSRVLRKPSRRTSLHQTPKRKSGGADADAGQSKMLDFLTLRKTMPRGCPKDDTAGGKAVDNTDCTKAFENSPKRRRHSLVGTVALDVPSPRKMIARRSQRVRQQQQRVRLFQ